MRFVLACYVGLVASEMEDANRGHLLFANKLASDSGAIFFSDKEGKRYRMLFNYTR